MKMNDRRLALGIAVLVPLLQFVILPFLGEINIAAKSYLWVFATLVGGAVFLKGRKEILLCRGMVPLAALWGVFFVSALQPSARYEASLLAGFLGLGLFFLLVVVHLAGSVPSFRNHLLNGLLLAGTFAAALGLYEYLRFLWLGPSRGTLIPYLMPVDRNFRVYGMFSQPNLFALFLLVCLLAFFYRYLHGGGDGISRPREAARHLPVFLLALVFFLTYSRAGLLAFCLTFGFLTWLAASGRYLRDDREGRKEFLKLCASVAAALAVFLLFHRLGPGGSDAARSLGAVSVGTDGRYVFWTSSILIFLDHPWLGVGLDNFQYFLSSKLISVHDLLGFVEYEALGYTSWSHNELLQILCEGGIFAFLIALGLLGLFVSKIRQRLVVRGGPIEPFFLYSHLFILPFVIQSMFSWPLRHPSLFALFLTLLGFLFSQYSLRAFPVPAAKRRVFTALIFAGMVVAAALFVQEVKLGSFYNHFHRTDRPEETLAELAELSHNPYSELRVLKETLPAYARYSFRENNAALAGRLLPFGERLAGLQGAQWQWYYLAHLYFAATKEQDARRAIIQAIGLQPAYDPSWEFLHHLNVLKASRETGRPVEDFLPKFSRDKEAVLESIQ